VPGGLVMQQLLYAPEVRGIDEVGVEEAQVKDGELKLAKQLIDQISSDTFDPTQYEDDVKKRIEAAVARKVEGEEIAISPDTPETGAQVIDLMEALRASLQQSSGKRATAKPAASSADRGAARSAKTAPEPARASTKRPAAKVEAAVAPRRKVAKRKSA